MKLFILASDLVRQRACQAIMAAPEGYAVRISEATRSLKQNAALWALLNEISEQVDWYGQKLTDEEWKDVLTASLKKQKAVPGIDGGFVILGQRTSKMTKSDFSDLLALAQAFAAERGLK